MIRTPTRLSILETDEGEPQTLQIEAEGDPTTLVHFQYTGEEGLEDDDEDEDE